MTQPRQAQTSLMRQRSAALSALLDADCASFGQYGLCVSAQARATVGLSRGEDDGGGRASLAVRLHPNLRVGGAVELAPISGQPEGAVRADRNPSLSLFAVYQAPDGQGLTARVSGAMRSGGMTINRVSDADGEPGFGQASLRSRALAGEMGWGFAIGRAALLTPYLGLRYVSVTRGAYAEGVSATTQYPIFYDAFSERALSGHFGARLQAQIFDKVSANLTFGGAYDLARGSSGFTGWSAIPGLERFALPQQGAGRRLRPHAQAGFEWELAKNQKLVASAGLTTLPYATRAYLSARAGYQIGF
jgi:hypothetical protein